MASLLETKKKIGAVKNTKKITKAMQLVAASKMRQFQQKALQSRTYVWNLLQAVGPLAERDTQHPLSIAPATGKVLFVLYTSDKGLCGSLNGQLLRTLQQDSLWQSLPVSDRTLVTVGRKASDFATANAIPVEHSFKGLPEKMTTMDALEVVDYLMAQWLTGDYRAVYFVVPHYKNSFTFYPKVKQFLPLSQEMVAHYTVEEPTDAPLPQWNTDFVYMEPSEERVLEMLYQQVLETMFLQAFFELKASEYSSRMIAMQNATENASKIIDHLTLVYNKTRQQAITQQLSEIVAAGEAIL